MAYVLEYTRLHYYRRELARRMLLWLFALLVVVGLLFGSVVRTSSGHPTLRDELTGPYNDYVNQLHDLEAEWVQLQCLHTNMAPYLQLTSSPHPVTNVLESLVAKFDSDLVPEFLLPLKWTVAFNPCAFVGPEAALAENLSVELLLYADRFNETRLETAKTCLSDLLEDARPSLSGLEDGKDSGEVKAVYSLKGLRTLPVSAVLPKTVEKNRLYRDVIRKVDLGLHDGKTATLELAFRSCPDGSRTFAKEYDRFLDVGTLMRQRFTEAELKKPIVAFALGEWDKIADARYPWNRSPGQKLLDPATNYVPHADMRMLAEKLPRKSTLALARHHLLRQCGGLTNAMASSAFANLMDDELHGGPLAPAGLEVAGGSTCSFKVSAPSKRAPCWRRMDFEDGSSSLVAMASWSCDISAPAERGMGLTNLLGAAFAISKSGRGYEIDRVAVDFRKDERTVQRARFSGLVPLLNDMAAEE